MTRGRLQFDVVGTHDDVTDVAHENLALGKLREYSEGSDRSAGLDTKHRAAW